MLIVTMLKVTFCPCAAYYMSIVSGKVGWLLHCFSMMLTFVHLFTLRCAFVLRSEAEELHCIKVQM